MKLVKYFALLFLLFLLAFVVFVATQPATYKITKSKEITMPPSQVFEYVNDYSNWIDWQQFETSEDFKYTISSNPIGEKAYVKWDDTNLIATKFAHKDSIAQDYIEKDNKQSLHWKFIKVKSGTLANVTIQGELSFKEKIYSVLNGGITSYVGPQIEDGLTKINNYLVNELGNFKIDVHGLVVRPETNFIEQKDSCLTKDFNKKSKTLLTSMKSFIKNNNIQTLGVPFVIFHNNPNTSFIKYSMCVPVKDEILTTPESQIQGNHYDEFLAVKTILRGDYSHTKQAWSKARQFIYKNKFTEDKNGTYIGIYKRALPEVKEPSKWETEIYIPVVKRKPKKRIVNDSTKTNSETAPTIPENSIK